MKSSLDSHVMEFTCPHCSGKVKQSVGRLQSNPHLTCSHCGQGFDVATASLKKALKSAADNKAKFQRDVGKLFR